MLGPAAAPAAGRRYVAALTRRGRRAGRGWRSCESARRAPRARCGRAPPGPAPAPAGERQGGGGVSHFTRRARRQATRAARERDALSRELRAAREEGAQLGEERDQLRVQVRALKETFLIRLYTLNPGPLNPKP
jgi:hypothetical protein